MLNIHGSNINEDSTTMDTQFLGEIMEWNEQVEEANTKESLEILKKDVDFILIDLYKFVKFIGISLMHELLLIFICML